MHGTGVFGAGRRGCGCRLFLQVLRRGRLELRLAAGRAEVEATALIAGDMASGGTVDGHAADGVRRRQVVLRSIHELVPAAGIAEVEQPAGMRMARLDRKSTSLNSSH